jgi:crotonobetainyl-CoA:carnitine CoA-transferase CaiB-like acyl-CoA transferase
MCKHLGLEHLLDDERFQTDAGISANTKEIGDQVAAAIAARPYAYWVEHLQTLQGPWAPAQSPSEIVVDPQLDANGCFVPVVDAEGIERKLVANPVQFDEQPASVTRGPLLGEHTDDILRELGKSADEISRLRTEGACR